MGKRELLLLVVFVVLGVGVYQVSAPAAPADAPGFSLSRLVQMAKAHFHGPQVRRTVTRTATLTVPEGTDLPSGVPTEGRTAAPSSSKARTSPRSRYGSKRCSGAWTTPTWNGRRRPCSSK